MLLHVPLKFITHEDCSRIWASFNYVQDDNVCAGDNQINASACQVRDKILSLLERHYNVCTKSNLNETLIIFVALNDITNSYKPAERTTINLRLFFLVLKISDCFPET